MAHVVRRAFITSGVALLVLLLVGATYQGVATAFERRQFPHPGRLVDVGGHQLHLYCTGSGRPPVVLEAPEATMSAAWALVQTSVRRATRVCSYDRAGLGWSEAGDEPFAPDAAVSQLHSLLSQAGEGGPFIIVGAELGSMLARLYASRYPEETSGLVAVDVDGFAPSLARQSMAVNSNFKSSEKDFSCRHLIDQCVEPFDEKQFIVGRRAADFNRILRCDQFRVGDDCGQGYAGLLKRFGFGAAESADPDVSAVR